jgi:uncharacterized protein YjbJ (UPF0337 family)
MPRNTRLRTEGKLDQVKGKLKELAGRATGSRRAKAQGKVETLKGKSKDTAGRISSKR